MAMQDQRARLQPKPGGAEAILGTKNSTNLLFPLYSTNGVLFPYRPNVVTGSVSEYENIPFVHSIYTYNYYVRSYPKAISITADFTAQSNDEALYLLSVLHFFRAVTKSYFGVSPYNQAGTPPPTLIFNYLGEHLFSNVPVVVKNFDYTLPNTVDYVAVDTTGKVASSPNIKVTLPAGNSGGYTWVPTHLSVSLELETQYIPIKLRNEFNLNTFRKGKMMGDGYI